MTPAEVARGMFDAYVHQDRETAESLIGEDLVFTSPQDDHIDRAAFFERCFPTADRLVRQDLLHVAPTGGDGVFLLYEYELEDDGGTFRNAELLTVADGRIAEIQVFFGGQVR